ncbi:MAG: hypothetical protein ABL890_04525 [Candidatus Peribacteraceae bacterium]
MNVRLSLLRLTLLAVIAPIFLMSVADVALACEVGEQMCHGECIPSTSICILEPFPGGVTEIPSGDVGLKAFEYYINNGVWQLVYKIGVAATVFSGVLGGFQIIISNGDSSKIDEGKKRFIVSIYALIVLLLAGVILSFLNPVGFVNG